LEGSFPFTGRRHGPSPATHERVLGPERHAHGRGHLRAQEEGHRSHPAPQVDSLVPLARPLGPASRDLSRAAFGARLATHLLEGGVSIGQVSAYLGHSNLYSTLIYLHVTEISESKGREVQARLLEQLLGS
jgi:hypothetical protein